MVAPRMHVLRLVFSAFLTLVVLRAHDANEITAEAWIRGATIELTVTMARSTAMRVLAGGVEAQAFAPADFPTVRDRLAAIAPRLFDVTGGNVALKPRSARVALAVEDDVEFKLVYPLPTTLPLRFRATHVTSLPDEYGVALTVLAPNALLGQKLLVRADPVLEAARPTAGTGGGAKKER